MTIGKEPHTNGDVLKTPESTVYEIKVRSNKFLRINSKYLLSISIFFCALILFATYLAFFRNLSYKSGLEGDAFYYFRRSMLLLPLLLGGFLIIFISTIINIIINLIIAIKSKKAEWIKLLLAFSTLFPIGGFYLIKTESIGIPGAFHFLRGYEKWVEDHVDITAIQQWLVSLPAEYSEQSFFEATDFPEELPKAILKLNPYHMDFSKFKDGQRSVMFEWGSGLGHFGIVIGLPGMETPEEEELIKHDAHDFEYRRPIESGVYIFDRG